MPKCVSIVALVLLVPGLGGCRHTQTDHHSEPPLVTRAILHPEGDGAHLRVALEPAWSRRTDVGGQGWTVQDQITVAATVQWVNLGPDPAPTIVELRILRPGAPPPVSQIASANQEVQLVTSDEFDVAQCGDPCTIDLELAWHHGHTGELRVQWQVSAARGGYRQRPRMWFSWGYRTIEVPTVRRAAGGEAGSNVAGGPKP